MDRSAILTEAARLALLVVVTLVALYLLVRTGASYLRFYLRAPPPAWRNVARLAKETGAPIPVEMRTAQVRRELILRSSKPSLLSNNREFTVTGVKVDADPGEKRIFGFFHPNAHAGGGGERVLWVAVSATLKDPRNIVAIYVAAEKGVTHASLLERAVDRFGLQFHETELNRIVPIFLTQKKLIDPTTYPFLTLLGQAVGSVVLGYEAISNLMPDVFVDTTGLAFSYPVVRSLAQVPIIAYVHYPFVQADMLATLPLLSPKQLYWRGLLLAYRWAGARSDVVLANSEWTKRHISVIWPHCNPTVVYPPCAVQDFPRPDAASDSHRSPAFVYVAQFRPEKRHELIVRAFAKMAKAGRKAVGRSPSLIFVGAIRNNEDRERVLHLQVLARELGLNNDNFIIVENAPWTAIRRILDKSLVVLNAMWNEHFGMGVVEGMAAGLIPVVHASAGPLLDIVKDDLGTPGFFFKSRQDPDYKPSEYPELSEAMLQVLDLSAQQKIEYSERAWKAAQRFSDDAFVTAWTSQLRRADAMAESAGDHRAKARQNLASQADSR